MDIMKKKTAPAPSLAEEVEVKLPLYYKSASEYQPDGTTYTRLKTAGKHAHGSQITIAPSFIAWYPDIWIPTLPANYVEIDRAEFMEALAKVCDTCEEVTVEIMAECGTPPQV